MIKNYLLPLLNDDPKIKSLRAKAVNELEIFEAQCLIEHETIEIRLTCERLLREIHAESDTEKRLGLQTKLAVFQGPSAEVAASGARGRCLELYRPARATVITLMDATIVALQDLLVRALEDEAKLFKLWDTAPETTSLSTSIRTSIKQISDLRKEEAGTVIGSGLMPAHDHYFLSVLTGAVKNFPVGAGID